MIEPNAVDPYIRVNPVTKFIEPNWMWRDVLPFSLGPTNALYSSGGILLSTNDPVTVPYKLPHSSLGFDDAVGSPLEINEIVFLSSLGQSNPQFSVFVSDMGDQRQYMNYPIHVTTFAGSGQLAARLTEPLFMPTRHQLSVTFQRLSGGANTVQLYLLGKLFDTWSSNLQGHSEDRQRMINLVNKSLERRKYVTPYWMTTEGGAVTVPANQTVEVDSLVGDEGHFECSHILRNFTGGVPTNSPFELELINPQTRQSLMNGKIHSHMIGNAFNPQPFPAPFLVPAGQIVRFRITDLSGATNTVYLTLRGEKIRAPFKSRAEVEKELGIASSSPHASPAFKNTQMAGAN